MPVCIPDELPSAKILSEENVFVMSRSRSSTQDIRPLDIAILNLMPTKEKTETQLLRLVANTPLQVNVTLLHTATYESTHTNHQYLDTFYQTFDEIRDRHFDGLIITGAPIEQMDFEEVAYWEEITKIMSWAKKHVFSTMYICWAAQAGLYYHFGIGKHMLDKKMFGVFPHRVLNRNCRLMRGLDDVFYIPVSRHTSINEDEVYACDKLRVVASSEESGIGVIVSKDGRFVFATGHGEYDADTLASEYFRDVNKGLPIDVPKHYFPNDNPSQRPLLRWRANAALIFSNWLNYYVYQETPYDLRELSK